MQALVLGRELLRITHNHLTTRISNLPALYAMCVLSRARLTPKADPIVTKTPCSSNVTYSYCLYHCSKNLKRRSESVCSRASPKCRLNSITKVRPKTSNPQGMRSFAQWQWRLWCSRTQGTTATCKDALFDNLNRFRFKERWCHCMLHTLSMKESACCRRNGKAALASLHAKSIHWSHKHIGVL